MGCFISKHKSNSPTPFTKTNRSLPPRSPPSPHPLEETVKEVLSETPKLRSTTPRFSRAPKNSGYSLPNVQQFGERYEAQVKNKLKIANPEENSEVSDIYSSMSESFSTTTDMRDNVGEVQVRQRVNRSPENFNGRSYSDARKQREVAKSPARRPEQPSPNRVRIVPGRDRRFDSTNGKGITAARDAGESSRRRSRSPAIRSDNRQNLGRSPSARKTGKSPGRVRSDLSEKNRKREKGNKKEGKRPPTSNELLENPLVSLECFIFL